MWRARVQWREGMGLPEAAPGTTTGMRGDGMTSMLYTLPNRMVSTAGSLLDCTAQRIGGVQHADLALHVWPLLVRQIVRPRI